MKRNMALVLYYNKQNKYSFNALVGAIETEKYFDDLKIYFIRHENELITELQNIIKRHEKTVVGISFSTTQLWDIYRIKWGYALDGTYPNILWLRDRPSRTPLTKFA